MSTLLDEIRNISKEAADELERLNFVSDSDIKSLDRQDLLELLPGKDQLRVRKEIHQLICRSSKHETILKDLKDYFMSDLLPDGVTDMDTFLEALHKFKAYADDLINFLKTNMAKPHEKPSNQKVVKFTNSVSTFFSTTQDPFPEGSASNSNNSSQPRFWSTFFNFSSSGPKDTSGQRSDNEAVCHSSSRPPTPIKQMVMYKMVVSGKTLDKHLDVIERLKGPIPGHPVWLQLTESQRDEDSMVTIVFCPIVSRVGTDVDAALEGISSDKPIILVVMHHLHIPAPLPPPPTPYGVKLGVNVFFLESQGLLECSQNNDAINKMKTKLLEYSSKKSCINKIG